MKLLFTINLILLIITTNCYSAISPEDLGPLLKAFAIQHDGTLENIVRKTQKVWLRPKGQERFQMKDHYADRLEELRPLFRKLKMIDTIYPSHQYYDYLLIHGASLSVTQARIAFMAKLWQSGVRFKQLIFLTGERLLDHSREPLPKLRTEAEMTKWVYQHTDIPSDLRKIPVTFVDAPQSIGKDGRPKRPTTYDTLMAWLEFGPRPGDCLFITNQPFVGYQDAVSHAVLPSTWRTIETIGFAIPRSYESVSLYLDSLARCLYQQIAINKID